MKTSKYFLITIIMLVLAILACNDESEVIGVRSDQELITVGEVVENAPPLGTARSNPVPMGSGIIAYDMVFTVVDYERPADRTIERANRFNVMPQGYREYILIEMTISCEKSFDEKCIIKGSNFELVGDGGVIYNRRYVSGVKGGLITNEEFFGGTTITGKIPFIIERSETNLVLIYDPFLKSSIYFQIP